MALGRADVALLGADLGRLPRLIGLADMTRRVIGQNVWLAFGLSVVLLALAARGVLDPLKGVLAQSVAVPIVVANSARISRFSHRGPHVAEYGFAKEFCRVRFASRVSGWRSQPGFF